MSDRTLGLIAWILFALGVVLTVATLGLGLTRGPTRGLIYFVGDIHWFLSFVLFLPVGALISTRHPRNAVGWLLLVIGLSEVVSRFAFEYAARALIVDPGSLPFGGGAAWLSFWAWAPGFGLFSLLLLVFPTGKALSPRWMWAGWIPVAWLTAFVVVSIRLWPHRTAELLVASEEVLPKELSSIDRAVLASFPVVLLCLAAAMVSLIVRFRRSRGVERQQLKWIALVAGFSVINLVIADLVLSPLGLENRTTILIGETLAGPGLFAVMVGVAMLRYRLYDIDVVINRALVYGTLTAILAGLYVAIVFGLQSVLSPITAESDLAIAGSTLVVAALFRPIRTRVQGFIDHRFYRRKFDAQHTVEQFGAHLRDEVELASISDQLVDVIRNTMQPAHVSVWLVRGSP